MSYIEVDQSGRMEMPGETTVAVSNDFTVTVRVTARVKREVREALLERGVKPRMVMIRMFVGAILLAIHKHLDKVSVLRIDEEYTGYEAVIKSLLLDRMRSLGSAGCDVVITRLRKSSPAHRAAIRVTRRQATADYAIGRETAGSLLKGKRNDRVQPFGLTAPHHPGGVPGIRSGPPDLHSL